MKNFLGTELKTDYSIDQAILDQSSKLIILEFYSRSKKSKIENFKFISFFKKKIFKFIRFYRISIDNTKEFNSMYEIKGVNSVLFFYKNRKIFIDSDS